MEQNESSKSLRDTLQLFADSPLEDLVKKATSALDKGIKIGETTIYTLRTAKRDGWVYFSNYNDYMRLYKIREDGTQMQKLNDEKSYDIDVIGEWVYYHNSEDGKAYQIRTDGTERQLAW